MRKEKRKPFFKKYINGTKGVISLFLAILMVPFVSIAGVLINAGRINSAVAIFDEALCNASNSTLGTYDEFLRERFGLLAMSQNTANGGTQFGNTSANYTADQFLNDLFIYYMEQNVGSLSNTYTTTDISATGLYPLADPNILRNSVLQSSKITVPAKLIADWGSVDKMLSQLTDQFKLFESFTTTLGSGAKVVSGVDELLEKQDALEEQIEKCNEARTAYNTAYTEFETAANSFNTLVDNINYWAGQVTTYQNQLNELDKKVVDINNQIAAKTQKIKELSEDTKNNHKEEIKTLEEEIETLKEEREEKAPGYNATVSNLSSAQSTLSSYKGQFSGKRTTAINKQDAYYDTIVALRDEIDKTATAVVAFQDSLNSLINNGLDLIGNAVTTGYRVAQAGIDKTKEKMAEDNEYYSYQQTLAENEGYDEEAADYYNMIQENTTAGINLDEKKNSYKNDITAVSKAQSTMKTVNSGLTDFADRDIKAEYKVIYDKLEELRIKVSNRTVPNSYTRLAYSDCHYEVVNPLEKAEIGQILENIKDQFVNNAGWAALKAALSFFEALLTINLDHHWELTSVVDPSKYSANGGLPSQIDRDTYPLSSPYEAEDAALSQAYKDLLSGYGSGRGEGFTGSNSQDLITTIVDNFYILWDGIVDFELSKLTAMWDAVTAMINAFSQLGGFSEVFSAAGGIASAMVNNVWLVGYITYNTSNRTTYQGKALTGASFGLPDAANTDGYLFAGAETEYIFNGSMDEVENQQAVFWALMIERALFNIGNIMADGTIQTIANTLGSFTFGIGAVLTDILFLFLESAVDVIIMANGGNIPIVKTFVYVTPTGIPKLVEKVFSLSLTESQKKSLYETCSNGAYTFNEKAKDVAITYGEYGDYYEQSVNLPRYDDYKTQQSDLDKQNKVSDLFVFTYTKSLQLYMVVLSSPLNNINRLADIIQMEAAYKAATGQVAGYNFNLDKSYTYIRATGSFTSNVFIQVGEDDTLNSKHRVIYNGY